MLVMASFSPSILKWSHLNAIKVNNFFLPDLDNFMILCIYLHVSPDFSACDYISLEVFSCIRIRTEFGY